MKIQLIRNATMKLTYADRTILTDPMLSPKDAIKSFAGRSRNPTVDLPFEISEVIGDVELVIVSHNHPDHIDAVAAEELPKQMPLLCQLGDKAALAAMGFINVVPVESKHMWQEINIIKTGGRHGQGKILKHMGQVSGFVFQADNEPTVYWVSDSILCKDVESSILDHKPDIIITHSGGATIPGYDPIIMDAKQTLALFDKISEDVVVVAIHMEALDHCMVSRPALQELARAKGVAETRLLIPQDGEIITF